MIEQLYAAYLQNPLICTDSRNILSGSIFFALKGDLFDGNEYALDALRKGAALAVVDNPELKNKECCFYVENVLDALQKLAKHHRAQLKIPIIGITGTNGKTTTKELCGSVLAKKYKTFYTQGNLNNHIGVPLSILSITKDIEIAVIEMGANHVGEIAALCKIAQPDYGLITNIGIAHLEGFGSFQNIIKAKTELYHWLDKRTDATVFVNSDNELLNQHLPSIETISYGLTETDSQYEIIERDAFASLLWKHKEIQSHLIGDYNIENIMASICIGNHFGVLAQEICSAIEDYQPVNNRSQVLESESNYIILDAYNANPSSMKQAIPNFSKLKKENKVLILGDMFELGEYSYVEHQKTVDLISKFSFDEVILIGPEFNLCKTNPGILKFNQLVDVLAYLKKHPLQNKSIFVKGSRGMKLETLTEVL